MGEGVTGTLGASPANQLRLELDQRYARLQPLVRFLTSHDVTERWMQFVFNEVVRQARRDCYSQHEKQAEPKLAIAINLELHAVVVSLREEIEHELRVKGEVEDEIEQDAPPDKEVVDPRPILREERDLTSTRKQALELERI